MVLYQSRHDATEYGRLAQLVEHLLDVQEVTGSSPVPSTTKIPSQMTRDFLRGQYRTRTAAEPTAACGVAVLFSSCTAHAKNPKSNDLGFLWWTVQDSNL